jgi:hypothetical protein
MVSILIHTGIIGLATASDDTTDIAYDVLGLEALFLVPRIFSLLSLHPYFGTLVRTVWPTSRPSPPAP